MIYEGKSKCIWEEPNEQIRQEFKDSLTAFNGTVKENLPGKGALCNAISSFLFEKLIEKGVVTHFVKKLSETEMLCEKVDIIPLEVVVRNHAAGSFCKRYGVAEGREIDLIEFFLKNDDLNDPLITVDAAICLGLVTSQEIEEIIGISKNINDILKHAFSKAGLILFDFKLEFGRKSGKIILADEISPDNCRLIDVETRRSFDKDLFRKKMGGILEAYQEVAHRLGV